MNNEMYFNLKEYIHAAENEYRRFAEYYRLTTFDELISFRRENPFGNYREGSFFFHGRGIHIVLEGKEIDWDFGYEFLKCGVNPRAFFDYIRRNERCSFEYDVVLQELKKGKQEGRLMEKHDLYYIT